MIDSHCHLDREPLLSNLNQVLIRSKNAGIEKLLTICTTTTEYTDILDIISRILVYSLVVVQIVNNFLTPASFALIKT